MSGIRPGARELIHANIDPGTWQGWDQPIDLDGLEVGYRATLERARTKAGTDEAVLTGRARIRGIDVALVVCEFGFLGGSIGRAASDRIVAAVRRATTERLPLIAATASGGTRMQEGTSAFVKMIDISRAVVDHKASGLPYLVYLRHPTTGGVYASWGSLAHVSVAEPGALIGFLGPAVYQALHGRPFPAGVQVAENLVEKGIIDAVVAPEDLADVAARALTLFGGATRQNDKSAADVTRVTAQEGASNPADAPPYESASAHDAWKSIELTRRGDRPGVRELLRYAADDVIPLNGTQEGESGEALLTALASFDEVSCVLIGQDRRTQAAHRPLGPGALRSARRGRAIAQELRQPLVCVIDTPGADLSAAAEEGALAGEIARCLADMVRLTVPSVSVLLGEGCGGGALALLPAQRVIAAEHAWLSPLPPEGASVILHGSPDHAAEMARRQGVRSNDLLNKGIVHAVVPEHPPAHEDPAGFATRVAVTIVDQIQLQQ